MTWSYCICLFASFECYLFAVVIILFNLLLSFSLNETLKVWIKKKKINCSETEKVPISTRSKEKQKFHSVLLIIRTVSFITAVNSLKICKYPLKKKTPLVNTRTMQDSYVVFRVRYNVINNSRLGQLNVSQYIYIYIFIVPLKLSKKILNSAGAVVTCNCRLCI